jgi:chitodextrinase
MSSKHAYRRVPVRRFLRGIVAIAALSALALSGPSRANAAACQTTGPTAGAYTVTICLTAPLDGASVFGVTPVTATVSTTGTSPGVQKLFFYLDGQYALTDYQAPYSFNIPTDQYVDGVKTIEVEASMRDGYVTAPRASLSATFTNGVTTPPVNNRTFTPKTGTAPPAGQPFVIAASGDGAGGETSENDVTRLISSWNPNLFLYLGDVYEKGTPLEFYNNYAPAGDYGDFKPITDPTIGNHEYTNGVAAGYFDYWDNAPHYYSVNVGGWHLISLDANSAFNQFQPGSAQYQWLVNDLQSSNAACTLAYWHQPLFNIGDEGPTTAMAPMWSLLQQHGVDIVLNGHDHTYQRWVPMDSAGNPDPTGPTELVVGTGGHALGAFPSSSGNVAATALQFGAMRLDLGANGATYQFVSTAGQTLDSGSVQCSGSSDATAPSKPTNLTATAQSRTQIGLSWTASTDNVGVTGYEIWRDGSLLTTITPNTTYSDTTVAASSTHTYTIRALDAAGNKSAFSDPATATSLANGLLFTDGFETGDFSNWTSVNGLVAQQQELLSGSWAARGTTTATPAFALKQLTTQRSELYYQTRFKVISQGANSIYLQRFRTGTAGLLTTTFISSTGKIGLRNDQGSTTTTTSTATAASGSWHTIETHLLVNGASSLVEVWLDGNKIDALTSTLSLGTAPIGQVLLGDNSSNRTYDVVYDDVAYDPGFISDTQGPSVPGTLTATSPSGAEVDLAWGPSTDDVGVVGYDIYRNGQPLTTVGAVTSYADKTVSAHSSYSYQVRARDAVGNVSAFGNTANVSTADIFSDDFENGDMTRWTSSSAITVLSGIGTGGSYGARAVSTGSGASASKTLAANMNELYVRARFKIVSQGANSINLLRLRSGPTAQALVTLLVTSTDKLAYRNEVGGTLSTSSTAVSLNAWHEAELHVLVNDTSSKVEVWLDGVSVFSATEALGTTPISRMELGDSSASRTYDTRFDDVLADASFIPFTGLPADPAGPSAPIGLAATAQSPSSVGLTWGLPNSGTADSYHVFRDGTEVAVLDGSTTTYVDTGLTDATAYTYTVRAVDLAGNSSPDSNSASATTPDGTAPSAPGNVNASAVSASRIDVSWSASSDNVGITGYQIFRDGAQVGTAGSAATSYSDTGLNQLTAYTYTVKATDAAGNVSDPSGSAGATTLDGTAPTVPGTLAATAVSGSEIDLSWAGSSDNVGVTGYQIFRNGAQVGTAGAGATTYNDTGLASYVQYAYTVRATDAAGNVSGDSNLASARTLDAIAPTAPTGLVASSPTATQVNLSWSSATDNVGVTGYQIFRGGSQIGTVGSVTTYTDSTVLAGTTYSYTVKAVDAALNVSPASTAASVTTLLFFDGFETGDFSLWTNSVGLQAQQGTAFAGVWAARGSSTGTPTYAIKTLSATRTSVYFETRFNIAALKKSTVNLLRFRTASGTPLLTVYVDEPPRRIYYRNEVTGGNFTTLNVDTGVWHTIRAHISVSGSSSLIELWYDGTKIVTSTQNLGTNPIGQLELGNSVTGRTYDVRFDNVLATVTP